MDHRYAPKVQLRDTAYCPVHSLDEENETDHLVLVAKSLQGAIHDLRRQLMKAQRRLRGITTQKSFERKGGVHVAQQHNKVWPASNGKIWIDLPVPFVNIPSKMQSSEAKTQQEIIQSLQSKIAYYEETIRSFFRTIS